MAGNLGDIPARWAVEFHGAGIQDIGGGCLLLALVVVGVEVIVTAGAGSGRGAVTGAGKSDLFPIKLFTAHNTIPCLYEDGGCGIPFYCLPVTGEAVNNRNGLRDSSVTAGAGVCSLSLDLTRRAKRCVPSHGIVMVAERITVSFSANGAGLRRFTGGLYPVMTAEPTLRLAANGAGLRRYTSGVGPLVAERAPAGITAYTTGFRGGAGGILPFVVMKCYHPARAKKNTQQNEIENVPKEF